MSKKYTLSQNPIENGQNTLIATSKRENLWKDASSHKLVRKKAEIKPISRSSDRMNSEVWQFLLLPATGMWLGTVPSGNDFTLPSKVEHVWSLGVLTLCPKYNHRETRAQVSQKTCPRVFAAISFVIAAYWKQPTCPWKIEWDNLLQKWTLLVTQKYTCVKTHLHHQGLRTPEC